MIESDRWFINTNFFNVTAVTRRFIERLICYACWPWGKKDPQ